jgi:hypothetical protein
MRFGFRIGVIGLACLAAAAADRATVADLIGSVRSAMRMKKSDKELAKSLRKLVLEQRLEDRVIEELQSEGAGPGAVEEMIYLRDASARMPAPEPVPIFTSPPRPSIDEQKRFFRQVAANAFQYTRKLPDFICTQMVHRYTMGPVLSPDLLSATRPARGSLASQQMQTRWESKDTLTVKLTYFGNQEKYELIAVNGKKAKTTFESVGGAISEGEFGSTLLEVFALESGSQFRWDHWTHLRKRLTRVYSFTGSQEKSHYRIGTIDNLTDQHSIIVGRHGFVYADDETGMVMRIYVEADSIPHGYPVRAASSTLDYDFSMVGDQKFLLPLRAEARIHTARVQFRNVAEFTGYRKFTGESSISFDVPDAGSAPAATPAPVPSATVPSATPPK